MNLKGKRILLTGASGGVGWAAAKKLAKAGAVLALSARREERLQALAAEIAREGGTVPHVLPADLGQRGEADRLAQEAMNALGGVDILINNAGTTMQGLTWVVGDCDEARVQLETNVWSPLALIAGLAPAMVERGEGVIVNIGSMARVSAFPHLGHYSSSRAALAALSTMMSLELGPRGVRVVELDFGAIDTAASREVRQIAGVEHWLDGPAGLGSAEKAADAIVSAVEAGKSGFAFYPRALKWIDRFPALGRRFSKRVSKHADLTSTIIRRGGSQSTAPSR
ncbi:SDR family NAD(P)-dependent oxidoreductase [Lysobacter sp. CA199]|uniref:SDR family NAD(P)-dependent oxidoreductase n=1 Tax=Lysobacter sp. CA199 TaxID=3455608 RepID=UPI003F8D46A8